MPLTARTKVMGELLGSLGWRPMFHREVDLLGERGEVFEVRVPDGTLNLTVLPARVVSGLIVTSDKAIRVCVGDVAQNQPVTLGAGGVFALLGSDVESEYACALSYTPGDGSVATCVVLATVVQPVSAGVCTRILTHATLPNQFVACWDLEETDGDRIDHVGGLVLQPGGHVTTVSGYHGNAASLVGTVGSFLYGGDILPDLALHGFTLAFWVRARRFSTTGTYMMLVANGEAPGSGAAPAQFMIYVAPVLEPGRVLLTIQNSADAELLSATSLRLEEWELVMVWQTVTGTQTAMGIQLNQDTVATGTGTINAAYPHYARFCVGAMRGSLGETWDPLDGDIDTVMIWTRALSAEERAVIWNGGHG